MNEKLPEGWVWTTLGEISTKPQYGWTTKAKSTGGTVLLLRTTDISSGTIDWNIVPYCTEEPENLADYLLEADDIVISRAGSVGISYLLGDIPKQTVFASYLIRFHPLQGAEPRYVAYYLQTPDYWNRIYEESSGIALANVNARKLETIEIPLAPFPGQRRIVAAIEQQFTRLDSAVASLQSAKARAKQYRASLLKAAVEGELTKEWRVAHPSEETGAQLLARILAERRELWEEEQLAKMRERGIMLEDEKWKQAYKEPRIPNIEQLPVLPERWCWASLEQCSRRITDGTHHPPQFTETGVPFIFVKHIVKGQISFEDTKYISKTTYQKLNSRCPVELGDILYSAVGSYGVAVPVLISDPFSFQRHIAHIKPTFLLDLNYLVICLNSSVGLEQAHKVARGVAQKTVTLTDLARFVIPIPPLAEQERIIAEVEARLSNIAQMEETIEINLKRAEYERQSILREAFAGRLVPQDPQDEPASVLLERIREDRKRREEAEKIARVNRKGIRMESTKKRQAGKASLYTTLVEAGGQLSPDDLFRHAGLKTDEQPESVEVFYEELHAAVEDALIEETRPDDSHVLLEALEPSAEVLARMAEEEATRQAREAEHGGKAIDTPILWKF